MMDHHRSPEVWTPFTLTKNIKLQVPTTPSDDSETDEFERLLEASSLGSPAATRIRSRTSPNRAAEIRRRGPRLNSMRGDFDDTVLALARACASGDDRAVPRMSPDSGALPFGWRYAMPPGHFGMGKKSIFALENVWRGHGFPESPSGSPADDGLASRLLQYLLDEELIFAVSQETVDELIAIAFGRASSPPPVLQLVITQLLRRQLDEETCSDLMFEAQPPRRSAHASDIRNTTAAARETEIDQADHHDASTRIRRTFTFTRERPEGDGPSVVCRRRRKLWPDQVAPASKCQRMASIAVLHLVPSAGRPEWRPQRPYHLDAAIGRSGLFAMLTQLGDCGLSYENLTRPPAEAFSAHLGNHACFSDWTADFDLRFLRSAMRELPGNGSSRHPLDDMRLDAFLLPGRRHRKASSGVRPSGGRPEVSPGPVAAVPGQFTSFLSDIVHPLTARLAPGVPPSLSAFRLGDQLMGADLITLLLIKILGAMPSALSRERAILSWIQDNAFPLTRDTHQRNGGAFYDFTRLTQFRTRRIPLLPNSSVHGCRQ
jgi:hypothetical protein